MGRQGHGQATTGRQASARLAPKRRWVHGELQGVKNRKQIIQVYSMVLLTPYSALLHHPAVLCSELCHRRVSASDLIPACAACTQARLLAPPHQPTGLQG